MVYNKYYRLGYCTEGNKLVVISPVLYLRDFGLLVMRRNNRENNTTKYVLIPVVL
jgi:hypothetical protein